MEIQTITDIAGMEKLRSQWQDLLDTAIRPSVFASWEWQYQCACLLDDKDSLLVLTVFDQDRLDAVLPLYQSKNQLSDLIPANIFSCLGGSITDYNVFVARQRKLSRVIPVLSEYLVNTGRIINLENVLPGTTLYILAQYLSRNGFRDIVYESKTALISDLGTDYGRFCKRLKRKFRKNLNNNRNHMLRDGGYSFHIEDTGDEQLCQLIRLHTARWEGKGESGALARERIRNFHAALSEADDKPFKIIYFTIRHNGNIIAIVYGYLFHDCFYAYLSGFDMDHNRISPGNMVLDHCIKSLIEKGINRMDMLRGDMQYKKSWATKSRSMKDRYLFPATFTGKLRYGALKVIMAIKRRVPVSLKKKLKMVYKNPYNSNNGNASVE